MDRSRALIGLSESDRTDFGRVAFAEQSEPQKTFSAIWELESQVNNGGFDQYFRNSETDEIAYAPAALKAIGAHKCCDIVDRALRLLGSLPPTREARAEVLDAFEQGEADSLEAFDQQFTSYPDDLTELLFEFVTRHPETFGPIK